MIVRVVALKNALPTAAAINATASTPVPAGNGTAFDLGGVKTSEQLYAAIHVLPTTCAVSRLASIIQSATSSGFTTPVTRVTFTDVTTTGGAAQWATPVAGPLSTDFRFWRAQYTVSSSAGAGFPALIEMGIQ